MLQVNHFCFGQPGNIESYYENFDNTFGIDGHLYNGKKYYRNNPGAIGNPFWISEENFTASIAMQGRTYANLQLKYELHRQVFILSFSDHIGAMQSIILNNHVIDSVIVNERTIIKNPFAEIENEFIEQVFTGTYSAYISHKKEFFFQNIGAKTGHQYSEDINEKFIVREDKIYPFKNKKSFYKIFPDQNKKQIKQYLSTHHIKIKSIEFSQYDELAKFCNSIVE